MTFKGQKEIITEALNNTTNLNELLEQIMIAAFNKGEEYGKLISKIKIQTAIAEIDNKLITITLEDDSDGYNEYICKEDVLNIISKQKVGE